jgi:hypothetical protein
MSSFTENKTAAQSTLGQEIQNNVSTLPAAGAPQMQNSFQNLFHVPVDKLRPHPEIKGFYPIFEEILEGIAEGIRESGFDIKFPLQVCPDGEGGYFVWDGLTRCAALTRFPKIKEVPAIISEFKSVEELFLAVIRIQGLRRKMTDAMLLKSVEKLQDFEAVKAKTRQGRRNDLNQTSPQDCGNVSMSANKAIALIVGKSEKTIEHAKAVLKNPEFREVVLASEISLNQAYDKLSAMNKPAANEPEPDPQGNAAGNANSPAEKQKAVEGTPEANQSEADAQVPGSETDKSNIETPSVKPESAAQKTGSVSTAANPVPDEKTKTIVITVDMLKFLFKYIPACNHKRLLLLNRQCSAEVTDLLRTVPALRNKIDVQPLLGLKGEIVF